jgi:hypothetical protein
LFLSFGVDFSLLNNYLHLVHLNLITKAQKRFTAEHLNESGQEDLFYQTTSINKIIRTYLSNSKTSL